jgi:hypothetical protein
VTAAPPPTPPRHKHANTSAHHPRGVSARLARGDVRRKYSKGVNVVVLQQMHRMPGHLVPTKHVHIVASPIKAK